MTLPPGPEWPVNQIGVPDRDGRLGIAPPGPGNAIALARHAHIRRAMERYPHAELSASGTSVGLPEGQMGNSEVGHLTLGAGAAVPQTLTLINDAVAAGRLAANEVVRAALSTRPARPPSRHGVQRRRSFRVRASPRADQTRRPARHPRPRAPLLHRRPRHLADLRRALPATRSRSGAPTRVSAASRPSSAASTRWTAIIAGSARRPPTT